MKVSRSMLSVLLGLLLVAGFAPSLRAQRTPDTAKQSAVEIAASNATIEDPSSVPGKNILTPDDEKFLDDLQRRGVRFFIDEQHPVTGLMPDRARANGGKSNDVASTASVGFGLTAFCIADSRGWISRDEAYERSLRVLKFLRDHGPKERGHFYHFLDMSTGKRVWECEVSNIDTALLMAGVLTVRQHFPNTELAKVADELYRAVDWPWLIKADGNLGMGWTPEKGLIPADWAGFSEGPVLIYLLALGSPTHPVSADTWHAWRRNPVITYAGLTYVQCPPLFTHQYPQAWFDLRGLRDDYMNYFRNTQLATIVQRQWTIDELSKRFPRYGPNLWGLTASDYEGGYVAWGGPPPEGPVDPKINGTVVPCAAAGSIAFQPRICIDALKSMKEKFGEKAYVKYGFVDAFNPETGWFNQDVIGIDVGPGVLMAENCRSAFVWKLFMSSPEARAAIKAAGFRPEKPGDVSVTSSVASPAATRPASPGRGK